MQGLFHDFTVSMLNVYIKYVNNYIIVCYVFYIQFYS